MLVGLFLIFDVSASVLLGSTMNTSTEISLPRYETSLLKKLHFDGLNFNSMLLESLLHKLDVVKVFFRCL